ncbi:hypothetical protein [Myroides phaeus]|uniref:Uncharacterized protein n=1 Tax=Myroides phaeus TaxID=702745 RepID=A0A1G8EEQ4_9FLAO|nr:hypothetical protein [Myroides phaeus]SDH68364.1 hypothetical protein SAMN05421818_11081 [Myroides phaeus]
MKKLILSASVAFSVLATTNVSAQQGFGTNAPDKSSAVDIVSSKRGLLIPRIELKNTGEASPVTKPAESLLVYNTTKTGDVTPGFYYWENNRWVRFVASNTEKTVTVTAGTNVDVVVDSSVLNTTDYKVSVKGGDKDGKVLVTKIDGSNSTTVWVDPKEFVSNAVSATNGLTVVNDKDGNSQFELGGALTKDLTTIGTGNGKNLAITGLTDVSDKFDGKEQKIVVMGADGILKITSPKSLIEESIKNGDITGRGLTSSSIVVSEKGKNALLQDVVIDIKGGSKAGQVLVTKGDGDNTTTEWVDASKLGNTVTANNGLTMDKDNNITLGGILISPTKITSDKTNTLAIAGLENAGKTTETNNIVVADKDGVLKQASAKDFVEDAISKGNLEAKTLKGAGITVTAGDKEGTDLSVASSLLKDVTLGIAKDAITSEKIADGEVKTSDLAGGAVTADKMTAGTVNGEGKVDYAAEGTVPVAGKDGKVTYQNVSATLGKTLTTDGKIVVGDDKKSEWPNSVLVETKLSIKEGSITTTEIADNAITSEKIKDGEVKTSDLSGGAVTADKMTAGTTNADGTVTKADKGTVPVAGEDGKVTYQNVSTTLGKTLTTDGVIVIGENGEAKETTATNSLLADVKLNIGKDKITADHIATGAVTSDEIADGTIQAVDMKSEGSSKVLVTNEKGEVIWTEQSALNNKDTFKGEGPIAINAGTDNTTGGKDYTISIANANGKDIAGVVKEADTAPTINFVNGVATVNVENISATQGKGLTSTSITVKDGDKALLHAASIEITPGATDGMVLVTTGTDIKTTKWVPAGELGNTVTANNGLTKDNKNNITLGGTLTSPTEITSDKTNTLAIKGLQPATGANKVVVVNGEGVLATVNQSMSPTVISSTTNISKIDGYSPLTPEVVIEVQIGSTDIDLELPAPSGAEGQTISVKIVNTVEPSAYLNIKANGTELTYGAMPFQGWIIKSNGTKWIIVGRN